jgi:hypothetical protein
VPRAPRGALFSISLVLLQERRGTAPHATLWLDFLKEHALTFLNWYWGMVATYADEVTWLGVALVVGGFYLRSRVR